MIPSILLLLLFAAISLGFNTNDQVDANLDYGSFQDPSSIVRPRFRYWIPDASVDLHIVADDVAKVKTAGMGGVELLGYYLYGNYPNLVAEGGPVPVDWTKYGWGTEAWVNLTSVALRKTKELGMIIDLSLGPNQGAGVPAEPDSEGIQWQLVPFNASVPIGGTFDGVLPGWGSGRLVSASTALVTTQTNATYTASPAFLGPIHYNGTRNVLDSSSLEDITDEVDDEGRLRVTFPSTIQGVEQRIFAYYEARSTYREQASPLELTTTVEQSPVTSYVQNGSWLADHFSAKGAQLIIDFWEKHLLDEETLQLVKEIGNYVWEDSMEIGAGALAWWTPQLLAAFRQGRGYDLNKYLPLIFSYDTQSNGPLASPDRFYLDTADLGQKFVNDYWQTLTELNRVYLESLTNWSTEALESQFSAQVGYNLPMDMLANIPAVNGPECEALGFNHVIDAYRQFSGPANRMSNAPRALQFLKRTDTHYTVAGKRIISSELGAQRQEVYSQTLPELIWDTKRSIAGSVNNFIYHGFPYTGDYPNTTWPGFTTFTYRFSNMHGPRQPSWEYYRDFMDWTARVQYVAQSGVPKIDLAFWLKKEQFFQKNSVYLPTDLEEAGYSYEYLSPDNFDLPEAIVENGVFAPKRQAFKALVVRGNDTLTEPGVEKLVSFAKAGLPIVFSGGLPQTLLGFDVSGQATQTVRNALNSIVGLDNVHIVPYENLAASLTSLGIYPRTQVAATRTWNSYWREDARNSITYVYVYNDARDSELGKGSSSGSIKFATTGVPYQYDAWTGAVTPILAYQQSGSSTTISLSLAGNQSTVIGFHHNEDTPKAVRPISLPAEVYHATSDVQGLVLKAGNTTQPVLLSNDTTIGLPVPAAPMQLDHWQLVVESWLPPVDLEADQTKPLLSNTTYNNVTLQPWNLISESLRNVSGRGFYSASFDWPPVNGTTHGGVLFLGAIVNTARAWVNGHQLPPLDPTDARADIGDYLVDGTNEVEVVVSTTLGNVLRPIHHKLKSSGTTWLGQEPIEQEYGLVSNVTVVPYLRTTIEL